MVGWFFWDKGQASTFSCAYLCNIIWSWSYLYKFSWCHHLFLREISEFNYHGRLFTPSYLIGMWHDTGCCRMETEWCILNFIYGILFSFKNWFIDVFFFNFPGKSRLHHCTMWFVSLTSLGDACGIVEDVLWNSIWFMLMIWTCVTTKIVAPCTIRNAGAGTCKASS